MSVQDGGGWMEDFARDFVALRERPARSLREDFCGSLSNSCAWVRMHGDNTSVAVDNDAEVLQWGREELDSSYSRLDEAERARVTVLLQDVLRPSGAAACGSAPAQRAGQAAGSGTGAGFDMICALNFSYSVFKQRRTLCEYFKCVKHALKPDGLFFLDLHGGRSVHTSGHTVRHDLGGDSESESESEGGEGGEGGAVDRGAGGSEKEGDEGGNGGALCVYEWEQERWDPINSGYMCHINFYFADGSAIKPAYTYDWRYYSLAELRDALADAGLHEQHVFWPDADETGALTGTYSEKLVGTDDETWTAYIAAGHGTPPPPPPPPPEVRS